MEIVQETINVPVDRSQLNELRARVGALCRRHGVDAKTTRRVILVLDEAISNVMEHSRTNGAAPIRLSLEISDETIVAEIRDEGVEFDPCREKKQPVPLGTSNRKYFKRGFGLYLIHLISDRVDYQRTDGGQNVLTLTIEGS